MLSRWWNTGRNAEIWRSQLPGQLPYHASLRNASQGTRANHISSKARSSIASATLKTSQVSTDRKPRPYELRDNVTTVRINHFELDRFTAPSMLFCFGDCHGKVFWPVTHEHRKLWTSVGDFSNISSRLCVRTAMQVGNSTISRPLLVLVGNSFAESRTGHVRHSNFAGVGINPVLAPSPSPLLRLSNITAISSGQRGWVYRDILWLHTSLYDP